MKLSIDTSDRKTVTVAIDGDVFEESARVGSSQKLLSFINVVLERKSSTIDDIEEIEVNTGPGSFTGLRVGVSVAQTLGWSLGVKVNGKDLRKGEIIVIKYR